MYKFVLFSIAISICSVAYSGSCKDCLTTFKDEVKACRSDKICSERAQERYEACKIGCN